MWGQDQTQSQVTLTAYQRKAIYKTLYFMIEELEECIDKCYPNWHDKKQIHDDNRPPIDSLEEAKESFSVALFGFNKALNNRPPHLLVELQNEFYKWFDGTGVNASNYPRSLSNVLLNTYEVLLGQGDSFAQETFNKADANINRMSKEERAKELGQAFVSLQLPLEDGRKEEDALVGKNYSDITIETRFGGTTERGKQTFEQIINRIISNMDLQ